VLLGATWGNYWELHGNKKTPIHKWFHLSLVLELMGNIFVLQLKFIDALAFIYVKDVFHDLHLNSKGCCF
jgi:hypothetical protein